MSPFVKKIVYALLGALAVVVAIRIALPRATVTGDARPASARHRSRDPPGRGRRR